MSHISGQWFNWGWQELLGVLFEIKMMAKKGVL